MLRPLMSELYNRQTEVINVLQLRELFNTDTELDSAAKNAVVLRKLVIIGVRPKVKT